MTREELEIIFKETESEWSGDNAFKGLEIIRKYVEYVLHAAEHDIIYSVDLDDIIEADITKEDAVNLRKLNWMISEEFDCLACFV